MSHATRLALGSLLAAVFVAGWAGFRIQEQGWRDEQRPADTIVVLGAAQYDGRPSPVLEARIRHGVALYDAGVAPLLIVTGGKASGDRTTEASAARDWAVAHGVPAAAILSEDRGRTTLESLEAVSAILLERGLRSAVFVSDRTHMLRVLRIATDRGITAWGSPTRTSPADAGAGTRLEAIVHELGALVVYFVGGGHVVIEDQLASSPCGPPDSRPGCTTFRRNPHDSLLAISAFAPILGRTSHASGPPRHPTAPVAPPAVPMVC